jgi:hypothetical protein
MQRTAESIAKQRATWARKRMEAGMQDEEAANEGHIPLSAIPKGRRPGSRRKARKGTAKAGKRAYRRRSKAGGGKGSQPVLTLTVQGHRQSMPLGTAFALYLALKSCFEGQK